MHVPHLVNTQVLRDRPSLSRPTRGSVSEPVIIFIPSLATLRASEDVSELFMLAPVLPTHDSDLSPKPTFSPNVEVE
jgi:hypothetical protein